MKYDTDILNAALAGPLTIGELAAIAFPHWAPTDALRAASTELLRLRGAGLIAGPGPDARYAVTERGALLARAAERRPLDVIRPIAETLRAKLAPNAVRIEIAGSVRRGKPTVGDVEIVALVEPDQPTLDPEARPEPGRALGDALAAEAALVLSRGSRCIRVIMDVRIGPVAVDLFVTADLREWGMLYFIRTGSADFVRRALGYWKRISHGGECRDNRLYRGDGTPVETKTEAAVFAALGVKFIAPEKRMPRKRNE